ncbi:MAG: hypothetical protein U1E10_16515, partial [Bdellovibrionales bacterium]|nr:hypothetical protein [Bdellovibrionales bacterium]
MNLALSRLAAVVFLSFVIAHSAIAGTVITDDVYQVLPGALDSIGINTKESFIYSNLAKVAVGALKQNVIPFVDSSDAN